MNLFSLILLLIVGLGACSTDKATHTLYKGNIANTRKAIIKTGELGGMKYVHAFHFTIGKAKYDYWVYLNRTPINKESIKYNLERSAYNGRNYVYTSAASDKNCTTDTALCDRILPEEYRILIFICQHLKEYNYQNRVTESSIRELKYWVRKP
jgi:hypothetical protein